MADQGLRLSDAIRLGSMLRPKAADGFFFSDGGSCAQGAALEATGTPYAAYVFGSTEPWVDKHARLRALWPWIKTGRVTCPACSEKGSPSHIIAHLNNEFGHDWTRERIADWVATIEPQPEPTFTIVAVTVDP